MKDERTVKDLLESYSENQINEGSQWNKASKIAGEIDTFFREYNLLIQSTKTKLISKIIELENLVERVPNNDEGVIDDYDEMKAFLMESKKLRAKLERQTPSLYDFSRTLDEYISLCTKHSIN